jgi:hypothetical protein
MWTINSQPLNEWLNFIHEFCVYERSIRLKEKEDALLDIYSSWLKTGDETLKENIIRLAREIQQLDPGLHFEELFKKLEKVKV